MLGLDEILKAKTPEELFGDLDNTVSASKAYRKLARTTHPDMFPAAKKHEAEEAFVNLTKLWEDHIGGVRPSKSIIKTKKHEYEIGLKLSSDDIYDRYQVTYDGGTEFAELLLTRSPRDNDLTQNHLRILQRLNIEVPEDYKMYFPTIVEHFQWKQENANYLTLATSTVEGMFSLAQVKERYPDGVDGKDLAWMFRRMLIAIDIPHSLDLIHGAATPENFIIQPLMHGVILRNWQYATEPQASSGVHVQTAIPAEYKDMYPKAVFNKEPVGIALDITMTAKTVMDTLVGPNTPRQLVAFLKGCMISNPPTAGSLLSEFDELLTRMYGKRVYHPFTMEY